MPDHLALRYIYLSTPSINRGWDVAYILGIHKMTPLIIIVKIPGSARIISGATDINCNHYIIDVYIYRKDKARCSV